MTKKRILKPTHDIMRLCEQHQIPVAIHQWASGVCLSQNMHVGLASPSCIIAEWPVLLDPLREGLRSEPFRIENGYLLPPQEPGLGVKLTKETMREYPFLIGTEMTTEKCIASYAHHPIGEDEVSLL